MVKSNMLFVFGVAFLSLYGCQNPNEVSETNLPYTTQSIFDQRYKSDWLVDSLRLKVFSGNYNAYAELRDIYFLSEHKNEFLFYAIYMADVHNNIEAQKDLRYLLHKGTLLKDSRIAIKMDSLLVDHVK